MKNISKQTLELIKRVERYSYPEECRMLQDAKSIRDIIEYCESKDIEIRVWQEGYLILERTCCVDLASISKLTLKDLRQILSWMKEFYRNNSFEMDARDSTSWRLVQYAKKKRLIEISRHSTWYWGDELFHNIQVRIL